MGGWTSGGLGWLASALAAPWPRLNFWVGDVAARSARRRPSAKTSLRPGGRRLHVVRLKLAGKIYLGYILLFLLTAALGGSAVFYLGRVERNAQRLAGRALPAWDFAGQAESLVREAGYFMVAYSLGNDEALYAQAQKPIQDMEALLVRTAGDSAASDTAAGREKIKADLAKYQAGMARSREAVMQAREGGQRIATATAAFFKTQETYLGLQQEAMLGQI